MRKRGSHSLDQLGEASREIRAQREETPGMARMTTTIWETLNPKNQEHEAEEAPSHAVLRTDDKVRLELLALSRETSPVATVLRFDMLKRTVLPKLLTQPTQWAVLLVYAATAICARLGFHIGEVSESASSFANAGVMVTFMIIFYVGYCYNRRGRREPNHHRRCSF